MGYLLATLEFYKATSWKTDDLTMRVCLCGCVCGGGGGGGGGGLGSKLRPRATLQTNLVSFSGLQGKVIF